jgi:hypothetical protein
MDIIDRGGSRTPLEARERGPVTDRAPHVVDLAFAADSTTNLSAAPEATQDTSAKTADVLALPQRNDDGHALPTERAVALLLGADRIASTWRPVGEIVVHVIARIRRDRP